MALEEDGWQTAQRKHKEGRRPQQQADHSLRCIVVSWTGKWVCRCGAKYHVEDECRACRIPPLCKDYLRNTCRDGPQKCAFSHPPFKLGAPPASVGSRQCLVAPEAVGIKLEEAQRMAQSSDPAEHCVISWTGAWLCRCARRYKVGTSCGDCGVPAPCKDYLRGCCALPEGFCPRSHPPFRLGKPPASCGTPACLVTREAVELAQKLPAAAKSAASRSTSSSSGGSSNSLEVTPRTVLLSASAAAAAAQVPAALAAGWEVQQYQAERLYAQMSGYAGQLAVPLPLPVSTVDSSWGAGPGSDWSGAGVGGGWQQPLTGAAACGAYHQGYGGAPALLQQPAGWQQQQPQSREAEDLDLALYLSLLGVGNGA